MSDQEPPRDRCGDGEGVRGLVIAARALLDHGGTVVRRQALRSALESVDAESKLPIADGGWPFSPAVLKILALARANSQRESDSIIRIAHVEAALKTLLNAEPSGGRRP